MQLVISDELSANTMSSDLTKTIFQSGWIVTAVTHGQPRCVNCFSRFYITCPTTSLTSELKKECPAANSNFLNLIPFHHNVWDQWIFWKCNALHVIEALKIEVDTTKSLVKDLRKKNKNIWTNTQSKYVIKWANFLTKTSVVWGIRKEQRLECKHLVVLQPRPALLVLIHWKSWCLKVQVICCLIIFWGKYGVMFQDRHMWSNMQTGTAQVLQRIIILLASDWLVHKLLCHSMTR
jgi:hypothetical protein